MGFEELAGLKELLSKRAQAEKAARGERPETPRDGQRRGDQVHAKHVPKSPRPSQPPHAGAAAIGETKPSRPAQGRHRRPAAAQTDRRGSASARSDVTPAADASNTTSTAPTTVAAAPTTGKPEHRRQGNNERRFDQRNKERRPERAASERTTPVDPVVVTIGQLQRRFPKAFPKNPAPKVALKLGISKDLVAQSTTLSLTEAEIMEAIKVWCQGSRYWAALTKEAPRVNLDGEPDGMVTPEQAARARSLSAMQRRAKRPAAKKPVVASATSGDAPATDAPANASVEAASDSVAPVGSDVAVESPTSAPAELQTTAAANEPSADAEVTQTVSSATDTH